MGVDVLEEFSKEFLLEIYKRMFRIRRFEETAINCSLKGQTFGNVHPCVYQEAIPVGVIAALEERDYVTASHRGHGVSIAKGATTDQMMAELFGKETGCCHGKGGSLHVTDVSKGVLGANGIVGAGISLAGGSALASKIRGTDEVSVAFFGDGASNAGVFHETMNMAATWKLPMVFVCEHNNWAVSVRTDRVTNTPSLSVRAKAYDIPGTTVDGNDALAVYRAAAEAVSGARAGNGPSLIECKTYRVLAHNVGDPMNYRTKEEIETAEYWKTERDPIILFRKTLDSCGIPQADIEAVHTEIEHEIAGAVEFADRSPYPNTNTLYDDVYTSDNERCVVR